MITLVFWNLRGRPLDALLAAVCKTAIDMGKSKEDTDYILCCATESGRIDRSTIQQKFGALMPGTTWRVFGAAPFVFVTNIPASLRTMEEYRHRACYFGFKHGFGNFLASFVHLSSPMGSWSPTESQAVKANKVREKLVDCEGRLTCDAVAIGDFNADPFSLAMISADGMHATMCRTIAAKGERRLGADDSERVGYFYNLMWRHYGDATPDRTPGTFYRSHREDALYWHALDQVLVRPSHIDSVVNTNTVVTKAGVVDLLSGGRIDNDISDHLPITVTLDLKGHSK